MKNKYKYFIKYIRSGKILDNNDWKVVIVFWQKLLYYNWKIWKNN